MDKKELSMAEIVRMAIGNQELANSPGSAVGIPGPQESQQTQINLKDIALLVGIDGIKPADDKSILGIVDNVVSIAKDMLETTSGVPKIENVERQLSEPADDVRQALSAVVQALSTLVSELEESNMSKNLEAFERKIDEIREAAEKTNDETEEQLEKGQPRRTPVSS